MDNFSLYGYLAKSKKYDLKRKCDKLQVKKGEYIYNPPASPPFMFEVFLGAVKIGGYSEKGGEVAHEMLASNEVFGNLQYLSRDNFQEFSRALTDLVLIRYKLDFYKFLIVHDPVVSEWFNKYVVERWSRMEKRFFSASSKKIDRRVEEIYVHYDKEVILPNGRKSSLIQFFSQQDIADLAAATRQSVAQALKRLSLKNQSHFLPDSAD